MGQGKKRDNKSSYRDQHRFWGPFVSGEILGCVNSKPYSKPEWVPSPCLKSKATDSSPASRLAGLRKPRPQSCRRPQVDSPPCNREI